MKPTAIFLFLFLGGCCEYSDGPPPPKAQTCSVAEDCKPAKASCFTWACELGACVPQLSKAGDTCEMCIDGEDGLCDGAGECRPNNGTTPACRPQ
jgi:hypothetical protein